MSLGELLSQQVSLGQRKIKGFLSGKLPLPLSKDGDFRICRPSLAGSPSPKMIRLRGGARLGEVAGGLKRFCYPPQRQQNIYFGDSRDSALGPRRPRALTHRVGKLRSAGGKETGHGRSMDFGLSRQREDNLVEIFGQRESQLESGLQRGAGSQGETVLEQGLVTPAIGLQG